MAIIIFVAAAAALCLLLVMLRDSNRFVTKEYRIACPGLKRNHRFVMLSDLHNKQYGAGNERLLAAVRKAEPEGILIAGDMLTSQSTGYVRPALELVKALAGSWPVYYGYGNHEYRMQTEPERYGSGFAAYRKELEEAGVIFLENESVLLPEAGIRIWGLQTGREYYKKCRRVSMEVSVLNRLLGRPEEGVFHILLAHNPEYFPAYAGWGADLVLSGHVHGGIMRLPLLGGVLSPSLRFFPKYDGGLFREGGSRMILGRGLGSHTIPVRVFNPGELVVIELLAER